MYRRKRNYALRLILVLFTIINHENCCRMFCQMDKHSESLRTYLPTYLTKTRELKWVITTLRLGLDMMFII